MKDVPALKLAVMNDLHVGGPQGGGFQNPFLTTDAASLIAPAVEAINAFSPDLVLIPGDLTHDATLEQLRQVLRCLDDLNAPFLACRGNHDRETGESKERFDLALGARARAGITAGSDAGLTDATAILVLESSWHKDGQPYEPDNPPLAVIDDGLAEQVLTDLDRIRPDLLLVVSHYPLISQADYVHISDGRYAGHVEGGGNFIRELTDRAGAVVVFCGHNHYHHIMCGERWLQCATGALIEYPAEFRLVTIENGSITIETTTAAQEVLAKAPTPKHPWVHGRPEDRQVIWRSE
jgi:predicted MPP superfamily phosphohydrolase